MLVNYAIKVDKNDKSKAVIAVVVLDNLNGGKTVFRTTEEYTVGTEGKYWAHLKALERVIRILNRLVSEGTIPREAPVTISLLSTVILTWLEKGKAVEPYRYAFEMLMRNLEGIPCVVEIIPDRKNSNRAICYLDKKYIKTEKYESVLTALADM